ncbi:hypothetical protein ACIQWA_40635 [Kitasatospora sp. NPDC098652]|uniref:hypothetical protein n=1 Tax=Kitasatospora sp. NPDC098652 TaxID=3364095 RepID=UPI00380EC5D9
MGPNDYLYSITVLGTGAQAHDAATGIDVWAKYFRTHDWGISITGCWTETTFEPDGNESHDWRIGRLMLPWSRIHRIDDSYNELRDFGDLDAWAKSEGLSADEIRKQEKAFRWATEGVSETVSELMASARPKA